MKNYLSNDFDFTKLVPYFDELPYWSAPFGLKLLDHIDYKQHICALDIGFGTGFPLTELAMRLGESATVYGIDPWTEAIERVVRKIEYYRITNIKIIEGIAESIPLDNNSIDLIVELKPCGLAFISLHKYNNKYDLPTFAGLFNLKSFL